MVAMVRIDGRLVATENAVISVVPATVVVDSEGARVRMSSGTTAARQLHEALCPVYVEQDRKERIAKEKREYEAKQQRATRRNHGL